MYGDSDPNTREVEHRIVQVHYPSQYGLYTVLSPRYAQKQYYKTRQWKSPKDTGTMFTNRYITIYFIRKISLGYSYSKVTLGYSYSTSYQPEDMKTKVILHYVYSDPYQLDAYPVLHVSEKTYSSYG